jgi:diaminopimelate decarboxylase
MDAFSYRGGHLHAEGLDCAQLAGRFGTPLYVYSKAAVTLRYRAFEEALRGGPHLICYAVKANSTLALLNVLASLGAGFDIVSGGELERVIRAGGDAAKVVFSGVGKREDELKRALQLGIRCFNVESRSELLRLNNVAGTLGLKAPVSLRVNPDVDAKTHPYIATGLSENKFGIDIVQAILLYREARDLPNIDIAGIDCHIGSQMTELSPLVDALKRVIGLADALASEGILLRHLDLGGGLGVRYREESPPTPQQWGEALRRELGGRPYEVMLEPGRAIVAEAGMLLTRVEHLKRSPKHDFAIVDAAMNDLMRPALYQAWHDIVPVIPRPDAPVVTYDVVGPVCETGDTLGKARSLALAEGDLLAILGAGAYGFSMSSNYNTRPRAAEVLVDGETAHVVRDRETLDDLMRGERIP